MMVPVRLGVELLLEGRGQGAQAGWWRLAAVGGWWGDYGVCWGAGIGGRAGVGGV